ncbi:hypothetical protein N8I77_013530 [Diaporthe amygdali]|uniref:Uncharacterized protein n=1 Tax=Phomopsis amygdali TaxID=1214568 RepID=A0AAD9S0V4_PHOAM|nr:hypothetical protein N8I77_013530 [Diaporthe amygdali]
MSLGLVASLETTSLDGCLAELDRATDRQVTVGPFGVLDLAQTEQEVASQPVAPQTDPGLASDNTFPEPDTTSPLSLDTLLGLDNTLQWGDLFDVNPAHIFATDASRLCFDPPDLSDSTWNWPDPLEASMQIDGMDQRTQPSGSTNSGLNRVPPTVPLVQSPVASHRNAVTPEVAQFLLSHFRANLSSITRTLPTGLKSPWEILNLPLAVQTFADLNFFEAKNLSHAAQANYFAVLSCAAYHASATPSARGCSPQLLTEDLASNTLNKAKNHMQMSLRAEVQGKSKAKYKDQLMAILMLTNHSIITGNEKDARCYILDAERLLRLRGLAKRHISRRVRLLHHVYTWMRIIGESTYVIHDYSTHGSNVERPTPHPQLDSLQAGGTPQLQDPQNGCLDDFLRLQPHASDSDLEIEELKEHETGRRDIHLEDSRESLDTLYPQVYGIPETWLSLVSQVTRLANLLDVVKSRPSSSSFDLSNSLQKRAKLLEEMICGFASRPTMCSGAHLSDEESQRQAAYRDGPNPHMLRALNAALEILFYRRVRDLHPRILQGYVSDVIDSLKTFEMALESHKLEGPCPVWPVFIAGCEAIRPRDREFFKDLTQRGMEQFGISSFKTAGDIMSRVWERRDRPLDDLGALNTPRSGALFRGSTKLRSASLQWTWVDALREEKTTLFLC